MALALGTRHVLLRWAVAGAFVLAAGTTSVLPAMAQSVGDGGSSAAATNQPSDAAASDADQAQATDAPAAPVHIVVTKPGAPAPAPARPQVDPLQGLPTGC
jgi:hypothetical protein